MILPAEKDSRPDPVISSIIMVWGADLIGDLIINPFPIRECLYLTIFDNLAVEYDNVIEEARILPIAEQTGLGKPEEALCTETVSNFKA
ncbi:MAG: hypothetical protein JXA19_01860 [Anaerolineales bacterium]|nr:hypothetical protein [Anaerolineales bacterium]